jgi:hypothetical protein
MADHIFELIGNFDLVLLIVILPTKLLVIRICGCDH